MVKKQDKNKKEDLKKLNADLDEKWKRSLAENQNLIRRFEKEKQDFIKYASKNVILELLPVLDNLLMLQEHIDDTGLKVTVNHFKDTLRRLGIEELDVLNKPYSGETSEAIDILEGDQDNIVAEVLQPGYSLNGLVIRPARVTSISKNSI